MGEAHTKFLFLFPVVKFPPTHQLQGKSSSLMDDNIHIEPHGNPHQVDAIVGFPCKTHFAQRPVNELLLLLDNSFSPVDNDFC